MKKVLLTILLLSSFANAADINLTTSNTVVIRTVIDADSTTKAQLHLQELVKARGNSNSTIYLVLDCPGGGIIEGDAFIQYAKTIPNLETITVFAASMCSSIVEQLPGKRHITQNGVLMFHRAHAGIEGYLNEGELEEQVRFIKSIVTQMEQLNANRLKISLEQYRQRVYTEWWLYGSDALQSKAADDVVDIKCNQKLIDSRVTEEVRTMFGNLKLDYSGCPLFRAPIGVGE